MKKVIIITGETATGKTNLALQLAQEHNGELINCDSRQIYKKLDILTNKDLLDHNFQKVETKNNFDIGYYNIPSKIWLYDVIDPKQFFSAYDFEQLTLPLIKKILNDGKTPIIVGGTYFYINYLLYQKNEMQDEPNWELRHRMDTMTVEELQKLLRELDETIYTSLNESDRANPRRLMRRIEMVQSNTMEIKNIIPTTIILGNKLNEQIEIEYRGLHYKDKNKFYDAIEKKATQRIEKGGIEEVEKLLKDGYTENDPGMKTIGYQQFIKYLRGKITKEKAVEEWKIREHQYAKRQYTFMKRDPHIRWTFI